MDLVPIDDEHVAQDEGDDELDDHPSGSDDLRKRILDDIEIAVFEDLVESPFEILLEILDFDELLLDHLDLLVEEWDRFGKIAQLLDDLRDEIGDGEDEEPDEKEIEEEDDRIGRSEGGQELPERAWVHLRDDPLIDLEMDEFTEAQEEIGEKERQEEEIDELLQEIEDGDEQNDPEQFLEEVSIEYQSGDGWQFHGFPTYLLKYILRDSDDILCRS